MTIAAPPEAAVRADAGSRDARIKSAADDLTASIQKEILSPDERLVSPANHL
jgi:hypothetical protein